MLKEREMIPPAENRACERIMCIPPLGLACVSSLTGRSFLAAACNVGESGLYIETWFPLEIDDHIRIHPKKLLPMGVPGRLLHENVGIVMWSEPARRDESPFHGAGIKFLIN
jgi:hypothetical protein